MNRRVALLVCLGIAVTVAGGLIVLVLSRSAPAPAENRVSEEAPLPTVSAPLPASTKKPGRVKEDGTPLVDPFIAAEAAGSATHTEQVEFGDIAIGAALEDLQVNALQMRENGMVQVGSPRLVTAKVIRVKKSASPPKATVKVCLDYSDVDVQTPDGTSVKDPKAPQRVASRLLLHRVDGSWLVAKRDFPAKSSC